MTISYPYRKIKTTFREINTMDQTHIHLVITHLPIFGSILGGQIRHSEIWKGATTPIDNTQSESDDD